MDFREESEYDRAQIWLTNLENGLAYLLKLNICMGIIQQFIPRDGPKGNSCRFATGHMCKNVHSCTDHSVKTWQQLKCPSTGEWIDELYYIHVAEYYMAIKTNELC